MAQWLTRWPQKSLDESPCEFESRLRYVPYKDKAARQAYAAKHYRDNKPEYAARRNEFRRTLRQTVNDLKESSPCVDCNTLYPYYVMQYDHIGTDKVASVSEVVRGKSLPFVLAEISKCELVCANCHAVRTHNRKMLRWRSG